MSLSEALDILSMFCASASLQLSVDAHVVPSILQLKVRSWSGRLTDYSYGR